MTARPDADSDELKAEIAAANLRRLRRAPAAGILIVGWNIALNLSVPSLRIFSLTVWQIVSLAIFALLLGLAFFYSREETTRRRQEDFVGGCAILLLVVCDGFFAVLWPHFANISSYSRGMLIASVLFLLPPGRFIPIAVANQAFFVFYLWQASPGFPWFSFLDGTISAIVACVVSAVLYDAKTDDFRKKQLIARQNAEMRELMAVAAHDLRSPLLGVKNLLELARSRADLTGEQLRAVMERAAAGCGHLLSLVTRLLEAHEAEQGGKNAVQRGDLRHFFRGAAIRIQPILEARNLRLEMDLPPDRAEALIDGEALNHVLDNLLSNAAKFSPPEATIWLALRAEDNHWLGEVRDEGEGIPETDQSALFRKFHRGSNRPPGGEPSAGLGLFIVRNLMAAMGGEVRFLPHTPHGSVFQFLLPRLLRVAERTSGRAENR